MTGFALGVDQEEWCARLRTLAAERLAPLAGKGEPGRVNRPLLAALGELGLLERVFTSGALDLCLLRESLAYGCTEAETALALQGLGAHPVLRAGSDAQRDRWLPEVRAGRAVAAFALSEPGAGSDAAALALAAVPDGAGWRLRGEKCWISNAPEADFYTVFARTGEAPGAKGVSAFLVPADRPGLGGEALDMLSPHPIGSLAFDGVPVGPEDLLGLPGQGFRVAMDTLNLFRPSVGAFAVGMARAALDATLAHTAARTAFGGVLGDLQAVAHRVAEMATRTEAARLLVYAAAAAHDRGSPDVPRRAAMAKLLATETAQYVVDHAVQLHGAVALRRGHLLEHLYREVRAPRIYEGASEVQRTIIAKELYRNLPAAPRGAEPAAPSGSPSEDPARDPSGGPFGAAVAR
ncbi:acyl-CoA dehydrogenase family protein [Streptomyces antarcticus]|uniref:acyl-CoA dehydrogenase family protein n=1 Tax=Streptomyces antarcticus TaxID=2996458 RepID=UPI00226DE16C|nr:MULTISPECIES: acyl-CoA dehydrogenase family protein [unclassified Streptomyces]MCY0940769.1 acyl-CoA dehydrogenase family protein [Streptomyces sp. H34-AA3]MCZ4082969.1 acyl-CoA dehydrogenase family protein [Streptomyces sp. H34-S5]